MGDKPSWPTPAASAPTVAGFADFAIIVVFAAAAILAVLLTC